MDIDVTFEADYKDDNINFSYDIINLSSQSVELLRALVYDPTGHYQEMGLDAIPALPQESIKSFFAGKSLFFRVDCAYRIDNGISRRFIKDCAIVWDSESQSPSVERTIYQKEESLAMTA